MIYQDFLGSNCHLIAPAPYCILPLPLPYLVRDAFAEYLAFLNRTVRLSPHEKTQAPNPFGSHHVRRGLRDDGAWLMDLAEGDLLTPVPQFRFWKISAMAFLIT